MAKKRDGGFLPSLTVDGLLIDVQDALGNSVGQAVYWEWNSQHPLPGVGDQMTVRATPLGTQSATATQRQTPAAEAMTGRVLSRHFDIQRDAQGNTSVWVRLIIQRSSSPAPLIAQTLLAGHTAHSSN